MLLKSLQRLPAYARVPSQQTRLVARLEATAARIATMASNLEMMQGDALQAGLYDGAIRLAAAIATR